MSSKTCDPARMRQDATPCNNKKIPPRPIDLFLRRRRELSQRQQKAIHLLLQGLGDEQVGAQLGVDRTTIFRWRQQVAFLRELDRQRRVIWERSANQLQAMVQPALDILRAQLTGEDPKMRI